MTRFIDVSHSVVEGMGGFRDGADLAELPLERLANLPAVIIDASHMGRAIAPDAWVGGGTFPVRAYVLADA